MSLSMSLLMCRSNAYASTFPFAFVEFGKMWVGLPGGWVQLFGSCILGRVGVVVQIILEATVVFHQRKGK